MATLVSPPERLPLSAEPRPDSPPTPQADQRIRRVVLIGAPNVGKSALFNRLTGRYTAVSNYPGTSVEITRGHGDFGGAAAEVVDTPGLYSLLVATEEERVARRVLFDDDVDVVVNVLDAKNLPRLLPLTLQLLETGRPVVVALNMMDEAERLGLSVDTDLLARRLGAAVVPVVAVTGSGLPQLRQAIAVAGAASHTHHPTYANGIGPAIGEVRSRLRGRYRVDATAVAALLLQGDREVQEMVSTIEPDPTTIASVVKRVEQGFEAPAAYRVAVERQRTASRLIDGVLGAPGPAGQRWVDDLGRWLARPLTGIPVLIVVVYLGLYLFVGRFSAGVVVDWIEATVFEQHVNPLFERLFAGLPWEAVRSLFVGEYGMLTLGLRYAVAIILPIVGAFFLFFSVLEDTGYFPRLAMLVDRLFKRLGLSGRAVIPMVLGFACDTMATMVTRTLETRRERLLATILLALAIPCSAQLGVILALLAHEPLALVTWAVAVVGSFVLVGALGARLIPGPPAIFHMEIPPLRRPRLGNVLAKTMARMQWYFLEVLPLFLLVSVLLWAGAITGAFPRVVAALEPLMGALGLPVEAARVFLFGFFRRDYGAAGLFDLTQDGMLNPVQLAVAGVTLTLFVPCVAQLLMMIRERGWKTAFGIVAFVTPFAFGAGFVVNVVLRSLP